MAFYECVLIARQDVSASQVESLVADYTKILEDNGGRVASSEYWGLRTLAYRIKKNRKGHYQMLRIDAPAEAVHEVERNMRLSDDVIRYMTVRVEELEEGPSIVMQQRNTRDDRGPRGDRRGGRRSGGDGPRGDGPRARRRPRANDGAPAPPASAPASEGAAE
ncbi:30S ribosomal protein S6 [Pelagibius marinus]|uniref:30S ribosomal protein S6 n=1 Tax=Pelagibius marinus TaxID=2762760 RepID=UPI00187262B8|nr:30S ribosomal protein S6 [Pelagibius marinus]